MSPPFTTAAVSIESILGVVMLLWLTTGLLDGGEAHFLEWMRLIITVSTISLEYARRFYIEGKM